MSGIVIAIIVIAAVIVLAAIGFALWQYQRRKRTEALQSQFGPEYDRTKQALGDDADSELASRKEKIDKYDIRQLSPEEQQKFRDEWTAVQARFVDQPGDAVVDADGVIREVMTTVGYPAGSFEQREEAASVRYPDAIQNYRKAHRIAVLQSNGQASTEDQRQAMLLFRSLFDKLVGMPAPEPAAAR